MVLFPGFFQLDLVPLPFMKVMISCIVRSSSNSGSPLGLLRILLPGFLELNLELLHLDLVFHLPNP